MVSRPLAISLGACLLAASTYVYAADTAGWYVGTGIGYAKNNVSNVTFDSDSNEKSNATGFKLYGGYQFSNHWGTELEYVDLGKFSNDSSNSHASIRTSGLGMSMTGTIPLSEQFTLFSKLGVFAKMSKAEEYTTSGNHSFSEKKVDVIPFLGIGAEYRFTPNVALRAEYEYFDRTTIGTNNVKLSNDLLSLSVRYSF